VASLARESGANTEADVSKGKRARTSTDSDAVEVKTKKQKVSAASIPRKRRGKGERVITQEHLDEALKAIEKEEHEPKKKKAPLRIVSPMVEVTLAMKRMAKERADDIKSNKKELKAQYIQQRDEKLKSLGLGECDKFYKEKLAEVREIAGKAAEDDSEEEMMIFVENAPVVGTSEAVLQAAVLEHTAPESTSDADNSVKVCQIPVTSTPISPSSSQPHVPESIEDNTVLENLVFHYSGELPKENVEPNSEKASETTLSEATQQQQALITPTTTITQN
jgi:hypothetical protein